MRDRLEQLVGEMVDKGIRYEDAQREFEKHFITRVVVNCDGNLGKAATHAGRPPQHADPEDPGPEDQGLR